MIDPKLIRDHTDDVRDHLSNRGADLAEFDSYVTLDKEWRAKSQDLEQLKHNRKLAQPKGKPSPEQQSQLSTLSSEIKQVESDFQMLDERLKKESLQFPNICLSEVPVGLDETHNVVIREEGSIPQFGFNAKSHDDLGKSLGLFDSERGAKLSGSRFSYFTGKGAKLERALTQFMLDLHTQDHGYTEISPPLLVHSDALVGTGQLPKFSDDLYQIKDSDLWLSPTAEVQLTNFYSSEILSSEDLPIKLTGFTPCFRKEAGSYGKDLKGLIRQHQFDKVELVQFVSPEESSTQLMSLLNEAEAVLKLLGLPYRVVSLCSGDLGFSSAQTYDIEVWFPSQNQYREISSCSNFLDFQSRRAMIRYRQEDKVGGYVHTLNGSGVAVGRAFAAVIENYQTAEGSITIPKALKPYFNSEETIVRSS